MQQLPGNTPIDLKLDLQTANLIIGALNEGPHKTVRAAIDNISQQVQTQVAKLLNPPASPATKATDTAA